MKVAILRGEVSKEVRKGGREGERERELKCDIGGTCRCQSS